MNMKHAEVLERCNINIILNLIDKGKNVKEIAKILGVNSKTLNYHLKKNGIVPSTSRYILDTNHNYFDEIDTEEKAYVLGYVLADGCVNVEPKKKNGEIYSYSKRLTFCSSIDDLEVILLIRNAICPNAKLKRIFNTKGAKVRKEQLSLRISSRKLVDILIDKYKIIPRKTYDTTFKFPFSTIPEELQRHFVRGFFDGDGCKGGNANFSGNISFIFTSSVFKDQIINWFSTNVPGITYSSNWIKGKTVDYCNTSFNLGYDIYQGVFDLFYKNAKYFLKRKIIKFNKQNTVVSSNSNTLETP